MKPDELFSSLGRAVDALAERAQRAGDSADAVLDLDAITVLRRERARLRLAADRHGRMLAMTPWSGVYLVGQRDAPEVWRCKGMGAVTLALVAAHPDRDVFPPPDRTRNAWNKAVGLALESLGKLDDHVARLLETTRLESGPGLRLRVVDGRVAARWTPPPNCDLHTDPPALGISFSGASLILTPPSHC